MTQDEIIEMARDTANHGTHASGEVIYTFYSEQLVAFAKLVAAKERESCAKVANQISDKYGYGYYGNEVDTADEIAAAIRARTGDKND
jgi:hypothetical protein